MSETKNTEVVRATSKLVQQAFKKLYFEWEVEHVRPMENFAAVIDGKRDSMLSKDEFIQAVEDHRYHAPANIPVKYGKFVKATGGFTRLTIKRPDGTSATAKYSFGPDDHFFKSLGIMKTAYKAVGAEIGPIVKELIKESKKTPQDAMADLEDYKEGQEAYWDGGSLEDMENRMMREGYITAQKECEEEVDIPF